MEVDRTYIKEITNVHYKAIRNLESGREAEKRKAKEHNTPANRSRYEKDEEQLERTGKEGSGQSWMENAGERPMLLDEG